MSETLPGKIAFVGTSCIGKTALLTFYKERYQHDNSVVFVEEAARLFFTSRIVDDPFSEASQSQVQNLALRLEQTAHDSGASTIFCDRSVLDAPAYVLALNNIEGSQRLLSRVKAWVPTYSALVLLDPNGIPYATDEVRTESADMRMMFHQGFLDLFNESGIQYHLVGGDIAARIQQIDEINETLRQG